MAKNISIKKNNDRFVDYEYDLRKTWWNDLQKARLSAIGARIKPGESVLDVGCNSGYFGEFCPKGCVVHGVDLSPALVEVAKTRLASAQVAPAESLPFPDKSIDVVTIAGVIEYVYDPNVVMKELFRVARRAVVGTADHETGTWGTHRVEGHKYMVRGYTEATLTEFLNKIGQMTHLSTIATSDGVKQHYVFEVVPHG